MSFIDGINYIVSGVNSRVKDSIKVMDKLSKDIKDLESSLKCVPFQIYLDTETVYEEDGGDPNWAVDSATYNVGIGWDGKRLLYLRDAIDRDEAPWTKNLIEMPYGKRFQMYQLILEIFENKPELIELSSPIMPRKDDFVFSGLIKRT